MNGDDVQQELESGVIALGAVFYGVLWVLIAWLAI